MSWCKPLLPRDHSLPTLANLPTSIGHGIADVVGIGVHDADVFLHRQAIAFVVAALVLIVLFKL